MNKVYCGACGKHIYNIRKDFNKVLIDANDLLPADKTIPVPIQGNETVCPKCKNNLFVRTLSGLKVMTNRGMIPNGN